MQVQQELELHQVIQEEQEVLVTMDLQEIQELEQHQVIQEEQEVLVL
jgi:hypothetical protein